MDINNDFAKNYTKMKRCQKYYTWVFYYFIVAGLLLTIYAFTSMTGLAWDWLAVAAGVDPLSPVSFVLIIDAFIVAPLNVFLVWRGALKHNDLSVILLLMLNLGNLAFLCVLWGHKFFHRIPLAFAVFLLYSIAALVLGGVNMKANITYHWLEEQPGFPLFNERAEEQRFDRIQRGIKDQFQQEMERRMKTASDSMSDLGAAGGELEKYVPEHKPSDMDSI